MKRFLQVIVFSSSSSFLPTIFISFLSWTLSLGAYALSPMNSYYDLTAGAGTAGGFHDGAFCNALFNGPLGLALNPNSRHLYVADQGNHCIRMIDLNHANQVTTLVGNGKKGFADGPFTAARFNQPTCLVYLPSNQILVNDAGNRRIRLIDLGQKRVSTLVYYGEPGDYQSRDTLPFQPDFVWSMAYLPSQNAIYYSQPRKGSLTKLDLKTSRTFKVLQDNPSLPQPAALCIHQNKLYVADLRKFEVYEIKVQHLSLKNKTIPPEDWRPCGTVYSALSLTWTGSNLYALEAFGPSPMVRLLPSEEPVTFVSVFGDLINSFKFPYFPYGQPFSPIQLAADPSSDKKIYLPQPNLNIITSFRDLDQGATKNSTLSNAYGIQDYDYPVSKPLNTFRILLVGDSHTFFFRILKQIPKLLSDITGMLILPKRLELMLNTTAALEDNPIHFEVLQFGRVSAEPLNLWPYYQVPDVIKKFDIDLVLLMVSPNYINNSLKAYFERKETLNQIPAEEFKPEYLLQPLKTRIPSGIPSELLNLCQAKGFATIKNNQIQFGDDSEMMKDKKIRDCMVELYSRPLKLLNAKLSKMKTKKGKSVKIELGLLPEIDFFLNSTESQEQFWKAVQLNTEIPAFDLTKQANVFRISFGPVSRTDSYGHFTTDEHLFLSFILAHELIWKKIVPFGSPTGE